LGDAFALTFTHKKGPGFVANEEEDTSLTGMPCHPFQPDKGGKKIIQMRNQTVKISIPSQKKWNSHQTWMQILNVRLLIKKMEENGVKHVCRSSGILLRVGMNMIVLWLRDGVF
jgi:hypothetical protein